MNLQITSTNIHLHESTRQIAIEKLGKIEKLLKDVGEELKEMRVVIDKGPRFGFTAKIELWIPTGSFAAKADGFSVLGVIDEAVEELAVQVNKHKGKVYRRNRKLLRRLKNLSFYSGSYYLT